LTGDHITLGVDVGSTTVKAVVVDPLSRAIVWSEYRRHETRLADTLLALLVEIGDAFAHLPLANVRIFITGSGAGPLCEPLGAKFVQEVNAVTMAVDALHPTRAASSSSAARTPRSSSTRRTRPAASARSRQ
jgi:activator of 2-hydroxyglutaryl-CoA dehydratase